MRQTDSLHCRALNSRDNSDLVFNKNARNKVVAKIIDAKRDFLENVIYPKKKKTEMKRELNSF